ncbi:MAG: formate dehydrogenase subunit alpha [Pseudomonadota bacterium]|nr:formate dehydrogenase subunit alpha [Pseudomonadota bacterium]
MTEIITFSINGEKVSAKVGESIWDVAKRINVEIPHLCHSGESGYRSDGNCRACMVEIEGERVLAASCIRMPTEGMIVNTESYRSKKARNTVLELLLADQPKIALAHDSSSHFWKTAKEQGIEVSRFPKVDATQVPILDSSHVAMTVNLDACIHCNLCVRACREVQVNDVIGMSGRGRNSKIVFDQDDQMGDSSCVACGECVQACPTGALMPANSLDTSQRGDSSDFDSETKSVCPFCGVGCQINIKVKDGKIKNVDGALGPANEQRLCVKGRFGYDYIHHPHRIKVPLIRRDDAPVKGMNVDLNNLPLHFREASWEEALDFAAQGLKHLNEKFGGQSIAGFGSAKCTNEEAYIFQKLIRQGFKHNNVDHCTRLCHASSVAALMENVGSAAVTATFNEIENADVAIVIGANPTENHPVAATYFKQFAKRGGKLIIMDPRGTSMARFARHMLQFKAGTDVSMLNAIMHVIVKEKLYDEQYIQAYTENWPQQKEHLEKFTPEEMEKVCGISSEKLRAVAREFANAKSGMIFWGMGVSQHIHGTNNSRCLISLALMCGHVGRPGTGLHPLRGQNNVQGASDAGLIPMFLPDYQSVTDDKIRSEIREIWGSDDFSSIKGLTVVEIMDAIHAEEIKGMYILGENPAMSDPDLNHARTALKKLRHLVVQDIFVTETANYADVILPAAAFAEKSGTVTNTNRQVQIARPAVLPPGEAKEDWWITTEIAKRLSLEWNYKKPRDIFDEMKLSMKSLDNITWDRLEIESSITYPSLSSIDPGQSIVFSEGFPRHDKRAKFTPASIIPPDEQPDDEFPLILTTGRQLEHWHTGSMTRRTYVLDQVEPEASCSIHPKTLTNLKIGLGEVIRVSSRRGSIELMARPDRNVPEDMIFMPFAFVEAAANLLTNPALDPIGKIPEFKFCAVKIEKLDVVAAE